MELAMKKNEKLIGQCLPDDLRDHLKRYLNTSDYGYVSHMHNNSPSPGTIDRIFRNDKPIPISENSLPAIKDLIELALIRIREEAQKSKVSKKVITAYRK